MQKINYYQILNVKSTAEESEIKKAYLKLAQKYHPDKNSGNKLAEKKFKQINRAYQILKNPDKRKKLDILLNQSSAPTSLRSSPPVKKETPDSFFQIKKTVKKQKIKEQALDLKIDFPITLEELCQKKTCRLTYLQPFLQKERKVPLLVQIPPKTFSGTKLLFKNKGGAQGGKEFGNLYIQLHLKIHPLFKIKNQDVHLKLPIMFPDSILGKKLEIPTPYGKVYLKIPKETKEGDVLKLAKMGLPETNRSLQGDMFVHIIVDYPGGEKIKIYNKLKTLSLKELPAFLEKHKASQNQYPLVTEYLLAYKDLKREL